MLSEILNFDTAGQHVVREPAGPAELCAYFLRLPLSTPGNCKRVIASFGRIPPIKPIHHISNLVLRHGFHGKKIYEFPAALHTLVHNHSDLHFCKWKGLYCGRCGLNLALVNCNRLRGCANCRL